MDDDGIQQLHHYPQRQRHRWRRRWGTASICANFRIFRRCLTSGFSTVRYGYRDAGMVTDIRQSTDDTDLWHAQVAGSLGFYDVDIRIHGSAVMSAACTCPYGQKHSYCKHVGAVLLTIADRQDERQTDAALPNDASEAVRWYWNDQFPGANGWKAVDVLDEQDWKAVRRVLENALGLPDSQLHLVSLIRANDSYTKRSSTSAQRGNQTNANMRLLVPLFHPHRRCTAASRLVHFP